MADGVYVAMITSMRTAPVVAAGEQSRAARCGLVIPLAVVSGVTGTADDAVRDAVDELITWT